MTATRTLLLSAALLGAAICAVPSNAQTLPALPQSYVDTSYPVMTGTTITVPSDDCAWTEVGTNAWPTVISGARAESPLATAKRYAYESRTIEVYGKLPLSFEANQGQSDPQVRFLAHGPQQTTFLTSTGAVLVLTSSKSKTNAPARQEVKSTQTVLRLTFLGANSRPPATGQNELPGKANYFIGNDPAKWHTNVPTYAGVHYQNLYPGIDLDYYGNQRRLEFDFVVRPGADVRQIRLHFAGAKGLRIDANGDLLLRTTAGTIRQKKPVVYQQVDGARHEIDARYVRESAYNVSVRADNYDASRPLVIDPVLVYSTYLGGSSDDFGYGIAVDGVGNAYVTGYTISADFPTTPGAFQTTNAGGYDAFVTKLNPTGSVLLYSTYLGGSNSDIGDGIAVDGAGNAYVTGYTASTDFPTTPDAFQTTNASNYAVAFVTKLNPAGSAPLVYSTYLGGSSGDSGNGIAVDSAGNAYVTGKTIGYQNSSNFPTTPGAFQTTNAGGSYDAFVTKLNPAGSAPLVYSTYLGGNSEDVAYGIAVDGAGNAYVTGYTGSTNFPTTPGAFQTTSSGSFDAFVTKLNPAGSAPLVYSTYLGGSSDDFGYGIAVDGVGNAYVTGYTGSTNFPTTPGAFQTTKAVSYDAFVTKVTFGNPCQDVVCTADQCHNPGTCNQATGVCSAPTNKTDGTTCNDGNACTKNDVCTGGVCAGRAFTCAAPDQCHQPGTCNGDGTCSYAPKPDNTACNDGNACTKNDVCTGGVCAGRAFTCAAPDQCHQPGTCNGDGTCSYAPKPDNTECNDQQLDECPARGEGDCEQAQGGGDVNDNENNGNQGDVNDNENNGNQNEGDFSFIVRRPSTTQRISGGLQYVNRADRTNVRSATLTSLLIAGNTATFAGTCTNNAVPCTFVVNVTDSGRRGKGDIFTISISGGPTRGGALRSGKIQVRPR